MNLSILKIVMIEMFFILKSQLKKVKKTYYRLNLLIF